MIIIGAQLYTVRDLLGSDDQIRQTLSGIKALGYGSVQLFGSLDLIRGCCQAAREVGLEVSGILTGMDECEVEEAQLFDVCRRYGVADLGISSGCREYEETMELIRRVNEFAPKAKAQGLTFSYHNHANEFQRTSCGKTVMELFLEHFDRETVTFMPDTYWLQCGGTDVRRFLELVKNRVSILHLKDMKYTPNGQRFAEIGQGNLYWEGIFRIARDCGIQQFAVEQDSCDGDPLESLKISMNYLKTIL